MKHLLLFVLIIAFAHVVADGVQPAGAGIEDDPYQITIFSNLLWVSTNPSSWESNFVQPYDVVLVSMPSGYIPIGNADQPFRGTYDGQGHIIDGLSISYGSSMGLFGRTNGATIKNLSVVNADIDGGDNLGILVGWCEDTLIDSCHVSGTVSGNDYVGGLVGDCSESSYVSNCSVDVIAHGDNSVGGIAGCLYNFAQIVDCESDAFVSGESRVGGVVGHNTIDGTVSGCQSSAHVVCEGQYTGGVVGRTNSAVITDCTFDGQVEGSTYSGGITGCSLDYATLSACANYGVVSGANYTGGIAGGNRSGSQIHDCISVGAIMGEGYTGGISGENQGGGVISQCRNSSEVSGLNRVGGLVGHQYGSADAYNSYSTGDILGNYAVGGLIGMASGGVVNCYSIGNVDADSGAGGLIGVSDTSGITGCFWNTETSGMAESQGGVGLTTAEMQSYATYIDAVWDFIDESANGTEDIWGLNPMENGGYPFLAWQGYAHVDNDEHEAPAPPLALLSPAYPNPFNPTTTIRYRLPQAGRATLTVYDIRGRRVATLVNASQPAGEHVVAWDAQGAASGVYLYRLTHNGRAETRSMVLMK